VEFGEGEGKVPLDNIAKRAAAYKQKERVTYKSMMPICHWLKTCLVEKYQKMDCHIFSIIYWILHVMKKYWGCIKRCVEGIYKYTRGASNFVLKRIGRCEKMKATDCLAEYF